MESAARAVSPQREPIALEYLDLPASAHLRRTRIQIAALERLAVDAMEGFKKVPKRGLEVGGVLLGRAAEECITIESIEPLESEHERGPSFLLSGKDKQRLAELVARRNAEDGMQVVGLYRSHTRAGPAPGEEDIGLLGEHCAGAAVLLLVRPCPGQPPLASLYASGDGLQEKPVEFPCDRGALAAAGRALVQVASGATPPPEARPPEPERRAHPPRLNSARVIEAMGLELERARQTQPPVELPRAPKRRLRMLSIWAAAIAVCGGAAGFGYARWWRVPAARPVAAAAIAPVRALALGVTWEGGALRLRWDREATVIRNAGGGVVWISDGAEERRIDLTRQELIEGSIAYWPTSSDVNFKLEVSGGAARVSESVRAVSVPRPQAAEPRRAEPEGHGREARPAAPVRVDMEVMKQRALSRLTGKAPITDPPKALHTVLPPVWGLTRRHAGEVEVDVRLDLDSAGKIKRAELASKHTDSHRDLEDLALYASRRWTFAPARTGLRKVPSAVVLHYHFGNPELAQSRLQAP